MNSFNYKRAAKALASLSLVLMMLSGCTGLNNNGTIPNSTASTDSLEVAKDMFSAEDFEVGYVESSSTLLECSDGSIACSEPSVKITGGTARITKAGTYMLTGSLNDGALIVDADGQSKVHIILDGISINSSGSPAIYISNAEKIFITTAADSVNTLSNSGKFNVIDGEDTDAVIYSKDDLTLNGSGSLTINSPAGNAVTANDNIFITSGSYNFNASAHAIEANDSVRIANASLEMSSGKDGIHAENKNDSKLGYFYMMSGNIKAASGGDGISAGAYMRVEGGNVDIVSGGGSDKSSENGSSEKGLKAGGDILLTNAELSIDSSDDSIHTSSALTINSGNITLKSGDDAIHSDGSFFITNGALDIKKSHEGIEALKIDISGGKINVQANEDGINAAGGQDNSDTSDPNDEYSDSKGKLSISGGEIYINALSDGIDVNGSLSISGGKTIVSCPIEGDTSALDYDISGVITGGVFIGTGAPQMLKTLNSDTQGVITVNIGEQTGNTPLILKDKAGNEIINITPVQPFSIAIISSPDINKGEAYTLSAGSYNNEVVSE